MYIKRITLLTTGILVLNLYAQTPLHKFAEHAKDRDIQPTEIITFLREHKHDRDLCNAISLKFNVWHNEVYDKEKWNEIVAQFLTLAHLCQESEKNPEDTRWLETLGTSFKEVRDLAIKGQGIVGNLSINVNDEGKISIEATVSHEDVYDETIWKDVVDLFITYLEQSELHKNQIEDWIRQLSPIFGDVIALLSETSGIHGSLDIRCCDKDNYCYIKCSD